MGVEGEEEEGDELEEMTLTILGELFSVSQLDEPKIVVLQAYKVLISTCK